MLCNAKMKEINSVDNHELSLSWQKVAFFREFTSKYLNLFLCPTTHFDFLHERKWGDYKSHNFVKIDFRRVSTSSYSAY